MQPQTKTKVGLSSKCLVNLSGGNQLIPFNVFTTILFDTVIYDTMNNFDEAVTHQFNAVYDGYYLVILHADWLTVPNGVQIAIEINRSGTTMFQQLKTGILGQDQSQILCGIVHLTVGQYVVGRAWNNNAAGVTVRAVPQRTYLNIIRLTH